MFATVPDNYDMFEMNEKERTIKKREIKEMLNGPGYEEIGTGIFVVEEDAYKYAMERVSQDDGLKQELVEWFYSGNWVKED